MQSGITTKIGSLDLVMVMKLAFTINAIPTRRVTQISDVHINQQMAINTIHQKQDPTLQAMIITK